MTQPASQAAGPGPELPPGKTVVIVPTYNEAANLPELLRRLMANRIPNLRVLVVDDNSPDGTADLTERLSPQYGGVVQVLRRPGKMGLGPAYLAGFARALEMGADYVVEMDADLSHQPEDVPRLLAQMGEYDVAIGSRWVKGGSADPGWGWARRTLSSWGSKYARLILGLKVHDTTTGFKCFRRHALEGLRIEQVKSRGYAFMVEVAYACQRRGYRVGEVPIRFDLRAQGRSKMSMRIVLEALWRVLQIRFART